MPSALADFRRQLLGKLTEATLISMVFVLNTHVNFAFCLQSYRQFNLAIHGAYSLLSNQQLPPFIL
jgi:hypothetical protein